MTVSMPRKLFISCSIALAFIAPASNPVLLPIAFGQDDFPPPPPPPPPPPGDVDGTDFPPPMNNEQDDFPTSDGAMDTPEDAPSNFNEPASKPSESKLKIGAPQKPAPSKRIPPGEELVSLNFPEPTAIKDIIKAVSEWTGKNFILPQNVTAKVQIISPQQMTKEEAYQAFLTALNTSGFTTVDTGKMVKIVATAKATGANIKTFYSSSWAPRTDEIITQIIPLKYIDARNVSTQLARILSDSRVVPFESTNSLIVTDTGHKVNRLIEIIKLLDVAGNQPQVTFVPLKNTDAQETSKKVQDIFGARGGGGASLYLQKVLIDERSNSLILLGPPRGLDDVVRFVRRLDRPLEEESSQAQIHVRPLDYADSEKLSQTLNSLAQGAGQARRPTALRPGTARNGAPTAAEIGNAKITFDKSSNALIVQGSKAAFNEIDGIVKQLDRRRDQVFVEADIIDVNLNSDLSVNLSVLGGATSGALKMPIGWRAKSAAPFLIDDKTASVEQQNAAAAAIPQSAIVGVMGAGDKIKLGGKDISPGAFIFALKQDQNSNVLSTPSVMVVDNEDANFEVTNRELVTGFTEDPVTKVKTSKQESIDASILLKLKPQISRADFINLDITIKADTFGRRDSNGTPVQTNKRSSSTKVIVQNSQTVVIGGLVQDTDIEGKSKVPILGDIPILGWFFRDTNTTKQKNSLNIFITPHVVRNPSDMARIYREKISQRNEFLSAFYGKGWKDKEVFKRAPDMDRAVVPPTRTPEPTPEPTPRPALKEEQVEEGPLPSEDPNPIVAPGGTSGGGGMGFSPEPFGGNNSGFDSIPPPPPPPPPPPGDMDGG